MLKFDVLNRWTGAVQFTAEIDATEETTRAIKLGLAVKWGLKNEVSLVAADLCAADLRDADLRAADLRDADLRAADLRAADLRAANLCAADLRAADLRDADLCAADLCAADLRAADLRAADLRDANLRAADLRDANLRAADLRDANLCDARIATIFPDIAVPSLHRKVLSSLEAGGRLKMGDWHHGDACGTTHCRAGWYIFHAGAPGRVLEACVGPATAGALIFAASCPDAGTIPNFYDGSSAALADIKRLAEAEPEIAAVVTK